MSPTEGFRQGVGSRAGENRAGEQAESDDTNGKDEFGNETGVWETAHQRLKGGRSIGGGADIQDTFSIKNRGGGDDDGPSGDLTGDHADKIVEAESLHKMMIHQDGAIFVN